MSAARDCSFDRAWLNEPGIFEPSDEHLYVEIKEVNAKVSYSEEPKSGEELPALCATATDPNARWALRLLITTRVYHRNSRRHVPYSTKMIDAFGKHWRISALCFGDRSSCSMPFNPVPCNPSWSGFMVRWIYSLPFTCTFCIAHNSSTKTTYAVCYGPDRTDKTAFLARLKRAKNDAFQPFLAPLIMTDLTLAGLERFSHTIYDDHIPVREAMGCNMYFQLAQDYVAPDLTEMPRRLTALANAVASNTSAMLHTAGVIEHMSEQIEQSHDVDDAEAALIVQMRDRLMLMRQIVANTKRRNEYIKESVKAQVQMVYALLAQKDNELNRRYGADMRVIAVVTLLFLPGTFVATLFSASFWDFSPANRGSVVSEWVWLYWIITIALTVAVLAVWRTHPRLRKRKPWRAAGADEESGKKDD